MSDEGDEGDEGDGGDEGDDLEPLKWLELFLCCFVVLEILLFLLLVLLLPNWVCFVAPLSCAIANMAAKPKGAPIGKLHKLEVFSFLKNLPQLGQFWSI